MQAWTGQWNYEVSTRSSLHSSTRLYPLSFVPRQWNRTWSGRVLPEVCLSRRYIFLSDIVLHDNGRAVPLSCASWRLWELFRGCWSFLFLKCLWGFFFKIVEIQLCKQWMWLLWVRFCWFVVLQSTTLYFVLSIAHCPRPKTFLLLHVTLARQGSHLVKVATAKMTNEDIYGLGKLIIYWCFVWS